MPNENPNPISRDPDQVSGEHANRQAYPLGDQTHGQFVQANRNLPVKEAVPQWVNSESITATTAVAQLGDSARTTFNTAFITLADANIRYWLDGSNPTASVGHVLAAGGDLILESSWELLNFKFIEVSGTPILSVSYGNR
jgi:hypothetical protein